MTKTIDEMSTEQLEKNAVRVAGLLEEIEGLLPGLVQFTAEQRQGTDGRFRGKDEEYALRAVLAVIERDPGAFRVLADKDDGRDPERVETELLRARMERRGLLARIAERVAPLAQRLDDTVLAQGEQCKPVLLSAYGIARTLAPHDPAIQTALAPALDYYGAIARKAARTRAGKKSGENK